MEEMSLEYLIRLTELLGPTLVAILTVPVMSGLKRLWGWIGSLPPWVQQLLVVLLAAVFTEIGTLLNVALPADVSLFTEADWSALLSAAMAYGIHAGKRARENAEAAEEAEVEAER